MFCTAWAYAFVAPSAAETLQQALAAAYKYNPRLDAARATLRATDEEVPRALSGYRPTVTGTADYAYQHTSTRPPSAGDGEVHPHGYALSASQPIFRGFRTLNQVREAEAAVRAGRETLRTTEISVLNDTIAAFMDVVRDQAIVRLRENNVTVLTRELKATQDRFQVGEVTRTDVAQAESRRAAAVSALELARANLKTSRANFERSVGHPPSNLVEPPPASRLLPKSLEEAIAISARENPTVVAALYREQGARATVDRIWGELLPEIRVDANHQRRFDTSRTTDEIEQTSVTGRLTVPIYAGGEVHARVRQAKHTHVSRLQEIEQARSDTQQTVVAAWSQLQAAKAQLVSDQTQVESNRVALSGVREEERVGQRTLLDVLNAEQELLNAEVQLVTTKRNLVVASYNVIGTIGRLNVSEIGATATVYDPDAHYHDVRRKWWGISITHSDGRRERLDLWDSHGRHQPVK
jgi:outer membrane protein